MKITVKLLGGCELSWEDGSPLEFATRKAKALMVLLATAPGMYRSREQITAVLWSRSAEEQARASLRQTLSELRRVLGPEQDILVADGSQIALNNQQVRLDVSDLEEAAASHSLDEQKQIMLLYRGDFLSGFSVRDNEFEDWATIERRRLKDMAISAMIRLIDDHLQRSDAEAGIPVAEALVHIDPLAEAGYRALMFFYGMQGRRNDALRQYETCRELLHQELGLAPSPDIENLYQTLRAGEFPADRQHRDTDVRPHGHYPEWVQDIRYCRSFDGTHIAYTYLDTQQPVMVKAGNWLTHLREDTQSPVWRPLLDALTTDFSLLRYDQRGMGLSDWDIQENTLDAYVADLEAVVDAAGLDRFVLFGICQAATISVVYAARHPERVKKLVLLSGMERGWRNRNDALDRQADAFATMTLKGWGKDTPAYRQIFSSLLIPDATHEHLQSFNDLQRRSASPENAVRLQQFLGYVDIRDQLEKVKTPTLVMHPQSDPFIPLKEGKRLAAGLPNARFLPLPSSNHLILNHEPAWPIMLRAIREFVRS